MRPGRTLLRLAAGLEWPISGQVLAPGAQRAHQAAQAAAGSLHAKYNNDILIMSRII